MQAALSVSPTSVRSWDRTARPDATQADPTEDVSVPFYRSTVIRMYTAFVYSMSIFEYMKIHEAATRHYPFWLYAVCALTFPTVPLVWLPVVRWMTIRWPFAPPERLRALGFHAVALIALVAFDVGFRPVFVRLSPLPVPPLTHPDWVIPGDAVLYVLIAGMFELARITRRYRALEVARAALGVRVAEARRRRTEAELRALKAELNPHFLGNALASVMALLETDARAADRALAKIGEMLGRLGRRSAHEITMEEELEGLEPVLEYERVRLSGMLVVERELGEGTADALVPDMILHPLVENAVKYGLAPRGGGTLRIAAERAGAHRELLVISVRDSGRRELSAGTTPAQGTGIGLSNVRSRLAELYGVNARLELEPDGARGMVARVTIPWRDETSPAAELPPEQDADAIADVVATPGATRRIMTRALGIAGKAARISAVVGVWAVVARLIANGNAAMALERGFRPDLIGHGLDAAWTAALRVALCLTAFELTRRLYGHRPSNALLRLHFAVATGFGVVGILEKVTIITMRAPERMHAMPWSHLFANMVNEIKANLVMYLAVVGLTLALPALWRLRLSRARRLRLQQRLEEERQRRAAAELRALEAELNPHFVGNALSVVSSLIHTDRAAAVRVLEDLGALLRAALSRAATHEVSLREELATLKSFLAVEHARLGRRLDVHWQVDERALDGQVPHMILQPLVENAVKHGLAPRGKAGRIDVEARRGERELELVVRDDGVGLSPGGESGGAGRTGVGLANTRARLSELYGPIAHLELSSGDMGGTVARVRIPWHRDVDAGLELAAGGVVEPMADGRSERSTAT